MLSHQSSLSADQAKKLQNQLNSLKTENQNLKQNLSEMNDKIIKLQNLINSKNQEIQSNNQKAHHLQEAHERTLKELKELKDLFEVREKEILEAGNQNFSKDTLIEQKQSEIQSLKAEIKELKLELECLKTGKPVPLHQHEQAHFLESKYILGSPHQIPYWECQLHDDQPKQNETWNKKRRLLRKKMPVQLDMDSLSTDINAESFNG